MAETAPAQALKSIGHRERRRKSRKSAEDLCLVTVEMEPAGFGLMLDVSEGGLGVQVMNRIEPDTTVQVAFKIPELSSRIEGSGTITWSDGDGRIGIRFQELKGEGGSVLKQWIDSLPESRVHEPLAVLPRHTQPALMEQVRAIQSQIAASSLNLDLVLQFLVERVVEMTHSNGGAIALGQNDEMFCRASTGLAPDVGARIGSGSALTSECLSTAKIVRCDDTEIDARVDREICRELNLRSSLILPILFEGRVRGVLEVFSPVANAFNDQHLALLQQLAEFTSQIVYGSKPPGIGETESPAKAQPKSEHTALSALLTATTKISEAAPQNSAPSKTASVAPVAPSPAVRKQAPPAIPVTVTPARQQTSSSSAAAAQPARISGRIKKATINEVPALAVPPSKRMGAAAVAQSLLDKDEETSSSPARIAVYAGIATFLLIVAALGWWYMSRSTKPVQQAAAATTSTSAVQPATPPAPGPAPSADPAATNAAATAQPAQPKPSKPPMVAPDTVRSPRAAIVEADPSAPLIIAGGNKPLPKRDTPVAEVPSVNIASDTSLAGINLPGATARPELRSQGAITGGQLIRRVEPIYPAFAKQQRIQGDIVLSARVNKDGTVDHIKRTSGSPVLEPAAVTALRQWKYDPYKLNGQAQEVDISVTIQFRLKQ